MPLRSVEAATRDDAIAAAREQFGPSARVVGVRRVRSGGVLGFFATERYVAEVATDLTNRPTVPHVTTAAEAALSDDVPADFSSPLASAAPARARATAPARNGAAAWAAEAVHSTDTAASTRTSTASSFPSSSRSAAPAARSSAPSWQATPVHPAALPPARRPAPVDDDRVNELASLLTAKQAEADTPTYARSTFPRASFPRTGREGSSTLLGDEVTAAPADRVADKRVIPADVPDAPSPFTAALARMVAGDRDVRQAVEEALVRPGAVRPGAGAGAEPRPTRPGRTAESSVPSPAARQEEETVGDQVIAPSTSMTRTVEVPTWAAEPEVATASVSSREEAIAEVLRSALAQGHSDEALAGILRKVLAGVSPQTALTAPDAEPEVATTAPPQVVLEGNVLQDLAVSSAPAFAVTVPEAVAPEFAVPEFAAPEAAAPEAVAAEYVAAAMPVVEFPAPEVVVSEVVVPEVVMPEPVPVLEAPVFEAPMFEAPMFEASVNETPTFEVPVFETRAASNVHTVEPTGPFTRATPSWAPTPAWVAAPAASMWGPPSMSATLWGERVMPTATAAPIGAEVASPEPAAESTAPATPVEASLFEERVEAVADEAAAGEAIPQEVIAEVATAQEPIPEAPTAAEAIEVIAGSAVDKSVEEESAVEQSSVEESVEEELLEAVAEELAPLLARTASDPAPMMSFDSTTVMPPLSLLPPLPGSRGRGRPPVPPAPSRRTAPPTTAPAAKTPVPMASAPTAAEPAAPETNAAVVPPVEDVWAPLRAPDHPFPSRSLATVTRLPVAPLMASPEIAEMPEHLFEPAPLRTGAVAESVASPVAPAAIASGEVADRLVGLGLPRDLLGATFADDVAERGTYAALTRALALRLRTAPELPNGAGEVLFVVGPGIETLRAAQSLAASLRLDPDRVQWATRGDLAGLAPESSRVTTVGAAINRREDAAIAGTVTVVAVEAPMRTDAYWTAQMMAIWTPVAVWAVVEATRKPEDLEPWIDGLPQVDALIVQDTDLSADPAAVLRQVDAPVALLDGARATPHRWASLLCERLENPQA